MTNQFSPKVSEVLSFSKDEAMRLACASVKPEHLLLGILRENPWQNPPPYEKLKGDLAGMYSRRINVQHRLVYQVFEKEKTVRILAMWTHYEN